MQCNTLKYHRVHYSVINYYTIQYIKVKCNTLQKNTVKHYSIIQYISNVCSKVHYRIQWQRTTMVNQCRKDIGKQGTVSGRRLEENNEQ